MAVKVFAGGQLFATTRLDSIPYAPVVFLHGWGRDRGDFGPLLDQLGGVAVDLPGFGSSPPPPDAWGADGYADCLGTLLAEIAGEYGPVVLVGHSFGGRVATCAAARGDDTVRAVLLMGTPLLRPTTSGSPATKLRLAKALARVGLVRSAYVETLRHRYGSSDYRAAQGVMRDVLVKAVNEQYPDELGRIRQPCALLWGRRDTAAPIDLARAAARHLPNLVEFSEVDAGHDVHLERPDEVTRLVRVLAGSSGS